MNTNRRIIDNLENFDYKLFGSNVIGVGYGLKEVGGKMTREKCIKFYVKMKLSPQYLSANEIIPSKLNLSYLPEAISTDVQEGEIEFNNCAEYSDYQTNPPGNRGRFRPIKGGISAINASDEGTTCTLGWVARDQYDNNAVGITNNHCVAYSLNLTHDFLDGSKDAALIGNHVTNPSPYDGGGVGQDTIGYLKRYLPWNRNSKIYVDAAVYALKQSVVGEGSDEFFGFNFSAPFLFATTEEIDDALNNNYELHSSGRTTGPKSGRAAKLRVTGLPSSISVGSQIGTFEFGDLIEFRAINTDGTVCNYPIAGGDSGSCLLASINGEVKIIGLCFAGSINTGFACRIDRIRDELCIGQFGVKIDNDWTRVDIKDGTASAPKNGKTVFSYILEPDMNLAKKKSTGNARTAASLRKTNEKGKKVYQDYFLLGQSTSSNFKTPSKGAGITGDFELENESIISKYVSCGTDISGSANEETWVPPTGGGNTNPPGGTPPSTGEAITGTMTVDLNIDTNEIQHVDFNNVVGKSLSNWHVMDQSGADPCAYPPQHGSFGPGFGHTWQGWALPKANPAGNCGSDGSKINGFETNGKGHFWPQLQLVQNYTQDTHAMVKAYDANAGDTYVYHLFYNARR